MKRSEMQSAEPSCSDRDPIWMDQTPVGKVIIHFATRCRRAVQAGDEPEATRCAHISSAVEDAVHEYQNAKMRGGE